MRTYLRHVMPIALAALAACSENKLEVGNSNDADVPGADGPIQCEYQGRMVGTGVDDVFPAGDGCNTCRCIPAVRQVMCSLMRCPQDGGVSDAGAGGSGGGTAACPFVASPKPITLGTILGAGKSPSTGTIYMVDQIDSLRRVFISDASGTLVRQRVSGSGDADPFMVVTTGGPDAIVTVQIDTPTGQPKRMGVVQGTLKDRKTMVIGQDGEELTMLADSEIAKMSLRNLPGTVTTEYVASTADGNFILVTRPTDDWSYSDFRVFFGPVTAMAERSVSNVSRAKDGGSTKIVFDLDGATATAYFPVVFADGGFAPGAATLTLGSQVAPLTRLSNPPAGAKYLSSSPELQGECSASPQCRWPAAVEANDAATNDQCRAGRFLVSCDLGNGTFSGGLRDDLSGCVNQCADNEYGLACGSIGPSASPTPEPPEGCHSASNTPAGIAYYCCPCL